MSADPMTEAVTALCDLRDTTEILEAMVAADLSGGHTLQAGLVDWLVGQQQAICDRMERAMTAARLVQP